MKDKGIRSILVAVDGSKPSMLAWNRAKALGKRLGARIEAVYVREWAALPAMVDARTQAMRTHRKLDSLRRALGRGAVLHALAGVATKSIHPFARARGYDMLVIGTHGRDWMGRALYGSVAEAVVRSSRIPVLVVGSAAGKARRGILAPVNEQPYAVEGLLAAARLALELGEPLTVLHSVEGSLSGRPESIKGIEEVLDRIIERVPEELRAAVKLKRELAFGDPARAVAEESSSYSLVVMASHAKGFLGDLVLGTTVERVLRHAGCPVLAVPSARPPAKSRRPVSGRRRSSAPGRPVSSRAFKTPAWARSRRRSRGVSIKF